MNESWAVFLRGSQPNGGGHKYMFAVPCTECLCVLCCGEQRERASHVLGAQGKWAQDEMIVL